MARKTVAVVGASQIRAKFGNKAVRAYVQQGWDVYPVNPRVREVEGLTAYARLEDIPVKLNRVSLYVPPSTGITLLPAIARLAPEEVFVNPGAESPELMARAEELGLSPTLACSIMAIGQTPDSFPD
jgi:predicted CoA-binding protein